MMTMNNSKIFETFGNVKKLMVLSTIKKHKNGFQTV